MPEPRRLQLSRRKGWKMPEGAVSVARPTRWGNPFRIGQDPGFPYNEISGPVGGHVVRDRTHAVELFAIHARIVSWYEESIRYELAGKSLACWCPLPAEGKPDICHGAVLLALANGWEMPSWLT